MLAKDIAEIDSSKKALREFGATLGCFFALVSLYIGWKTGRTPIILTGTSFLFLVFGIFAPGKLKGVQRIWMTAALLMGWVMTRVILTVVFYGLITPIRFIAGLFGENFLRPRRSDSSTYWQKSKITRLDLEEYKRQF